MAYRIGANGLPMLSSNASAPARFLHHEHTTRLERGVDVAQDARRVDLVVHGVEHEHGVELVGDVEARRVGHLEPDVVEARAGRLRRALARSHRRRGR